ncbi:MAG: 3-hydroxyacyl-ACP dehydratase [Bacteroidales bacterium]|nr:3-hydroxyacyl-ACP dehydratase [Bacteroidales bacterium]
MLVNPSDFEIRDLIPQRPPMVMIDKLVNAGEKKCEGVFHVSESNPLCLGNHLTEAGIIECIAQTAAAYTGYLRLSEKKNIVRGYIGSVKNLKIYSLPEADDEIRTEIILENELLGFTIITGRIICHERLIAECEMRILLEPDGSTTTV